MNNYKHNNYLQTLRELKPKLPFLKHIIDIGTSEDESLFQFDKVSQMGQTRQLLDQKKIDPADGIQIQFTCMS